MSRLQTPIPCAIALMVVALCHAEPDTQSQHEPFLGVLGPLEGVYAEAQVLLPATLAVGPSSQFRFKGQDSWFSFDRPLYLGAFPGEERSYAIEFKAADGTRQAILSYTIDMRPPEAPEFTQASGDIGGFFDLGVTGDGLILLSVDGSPFAPFEAGSIPTFKASPGGTSIVRAVAYCVDSVGNASRYIAGLWRLHPVDMEPSFTLQVVPPDVRIQPLKDASTLSVDLVPLLDSSRLSMSVPEGATPCVAVNASDPFASVASYAFLAEVKGASSCIIPFPWGYERELSVHYGYAKDGILFVAPEPLKILPVFSAEEGAGAPAIPVAPSIRLDDAMAYIDWPTSPWTMLVDSGNGVFARVSRPLIFGLGSQPLTIRYAALGQNGSRSASASLVLPARRIITEPVITGIEDGGSYGAMVLVLAQNKAGLRYEFTEGDEAPPPIHAGSPRMGQDGLRFEGRAGETVRYRLRVVTDVSSSSEGLSDDAYRERFYSFVIDKEAPPVPQTATGVSGYSSSDALISFNPQNGTIFVSVSETGQGDFLRYDGPIRVGGSKEGRKRYVVRAYSEDEFGNRSDQMKPVGILVDISSLYVDAGGRPDAVGGPDDPMPYLDDALDAAQAAGKRFIYVRGTVNLRRPVSIYGNITVTGGFDEEWGESPSNKAEIRVLQASQDTPYALSVQGGTLALASIVLTMSAEGSGGLIVSKQGVLTIDNVSMRLSGGIEKTAIKAEGGSLSLHASSLAFAGTFTARAVDTVGASLSLNDSTVTCDSSVRLFDAIRIRDADATLLGLRLDASPAQALSIVSATRASVSLERSVLLVKGGSSSCRVLSASASTLSVNSVYVDLSWQGSVEVLSASSSSSLHVAHMSAFVEAPRSVFAGSTGSIIDIVNTIAVSAGGDSLFMRSDTELQNSRLSSNCLWGFTRLMEGRHTLGALSEKNLQELNHLAGDVRPNITEDPSKTFYALAKGLRRLSEASACVDRGSPLDIKQSLDLFGKTRNKDKPDIGAEER